MFTTPSTHAKRTLEAGFSLVELMVVVTIIGILAGVAVPKFQTFKARAAQTEAKSGLNGVYLSMQAYMANYSDYPSATELPRASGNLIATTGAKGAGASVIGFAISGQRPKYNYSLDTVADAGGVPGHWAASAASNSTVGTNAANTKVFDWVRINTNKWSCSVYDGVAGVAATTTTDPTGKTARAARDCPEGNGLVATSSTFIPTRGAGDIPD